jgi:hypothetical protein
VDSKPEFIITNTGDTPVRFEDLELVYWFEDDPGQTYLFNCDWAQIGCENITGEFQIGADGASALRVRFHPGLEPLQSGQDSGEIKLRFNRADWTQFQQSDDYSFSPSPDYQEWENVAVYMGGNLIWGSEPGSSLTNPTMTPVATVPAISMATQSAPAASTVLENRIAVPAWVMLIVIMVLSIFVVVVLIAVILAFRKQR